MNLMNWTVIVGGVSVALLIVLVLVAVVTTLQRRAADRRPPAIRHQVSKGQRWVLNRHGVFIVESVDDTTAIGRYEGPGGILTNQAVSIAEIMERGRRVRTPKPGKKIPRLPPSKLPSPKTKDSRTGQIVNQYLLGRVERDRVRKVAMDRVTAARQPWTPIVARTSKTAFDGIDTSIPKHLRPRVNPYLDPED